MLEISLNEHVSLNPWAIIEPPFTARPNVSVGTSIIGAFTYLTSGCSFHQSIIGRYCSIGNNVRTLSSHDTNFLTTSPFHYQNMFGGEFSFNPKTKFSNYKTTVIGNDVWIGTNVLLVAGVSIGDGAVIGANSVVTRDVEPYTIVAGSPARAIKQRFNEKTIDKIIRTQWWSYDLIHNPIAVENPALALDQLEHYIKDGLIKYNPSHFMVMGTAGKFKINQLTDSNLAEIKSKLLDL